MAASQLEEISRHVESAKPALSVVVCTYRRFDHLRHLAAVLAKHYGHREDLEILVVDNSDDPTARNAFCASVALPANMRMIVSHPPGLARARNVGMEAACGKYLAYIDDDAQPSLDWLDTIIETFETNADASVVAGPILPVWPSGLRPKWLSKKYEGCLTILDLGDKQRRLEKYEYAYGANMAFRKDDLKSVGGFPIHLGRTGSIGLLSNEELEVQDKIRAQDRAITIQKRLCFITFIQTGSHRVGSAAECPGRLFPNACKMEPS